MCCDLLGKVLYLHVMRRPVWEATTGPFQDLAAASMAFLFHFKSLNPALDLANRPKPGNS